MNNSESQTPHHAGRRFPDITGHLLFWPIAIGGAAFDLWSKKAVFGWLPSIPDQKYVIIEGYFNFILRVNLGAAFSMFFGQRTFLTGISIAAFLVVIGIFLFSGIHRRIMQTALGCMIAGIIGNLYDRAFNEGMVRDFIDVTIPVIGYNWPTFNIADSLLCIGVGLLIIANLTAQADPARGPQQTKAR
jgi:signal peptidase II